MHLTVVLAVGLEPSLSATPSMDWNSAGYIIQSVGSIIEAIDHFRDGDFDMVLLGNSISVESRGSLISLIRAPDAQTPVVLIASRSAIFDSSANAALENDSFEILTGLGESLGKTAKLGVMPTILYGNGSKRAVVKR
jgi:DNA-binding NtrC family response regulator